MTHGESDSWSIRTLLLLQASNNESIHLMRAMLCDAIQAKYGNRSFKPVPLLESNNIYMTPDEILHQKPKKTEIQRLVTQNENTNNSNDSVTDCSDEMEIDLTCCVCKSVLFHVGNPIVECAECHAGYHKECHEPEIMEDISDPRVVWYCHNCSKTLQSRPKSLPTITFANSSKTTAPTSGKHSSITSRSNSPPVSTSYGSKTSFGSKRPLHNKLSVLSSSSSKLHSPKINIISADRRLQIMKKRAARKQDKRSNK